MSLRMASVMGAMLCVAGCSERTKSYVYALDSYDVSWEGGDSALEDELSQLLEDSDERLVLEFSEVRKGLRLDRQELNLWHAQDDGAGGLKAFSLVGSSLEVSMSGKPPDNLRYDVFLPEGELTLGDVTLLAPRGIWLSGQVSDGVFLYGELAFDAPPEAEPWEPGSLVDDILEAIIEDVFDFEESVALGFEEGAVDVSGINFAIVHAGEHVPDP